MLLHQNSITGFSKHFRRKIEKVKLLASHNLLFLSSHVFFFFKITFLYALLVLLSYHKMFILNKIVMWITSKNFWFSFRATFGLTTLKPIQKFSKCRKTIWVFIFLKYDKFWSSISLDNFILKYKPLFFSKAGLIESIFTCFECFVWHLYRREVHQFGDSWPQQ